MKDLWWLTLLNFVVLQWVCVRLAYVDSEAWRLGEDRLGEGSELGADRLWLLIVGVVPLTGWWSRLRMFGEPRVVELRKAGR